jgi:uncharacterized protein
MPNIDRHEPNTFCWVDLATNDPNAAKRFYSELFGWASKDSQVPGGGTNTMFFLRDRPMASAYQMNEGQKQMGVPPSWVCYVATKNADETLKAVERAGGKVLVPAFDMMDLGRMAMFADPTGAMLSLWQPKKHQGYGVVREPGAVCWNELMTRGADRAKQFYSAVFGWNFKVGEVAGGGAYHEFSAGTQSIGGIMEMSAEMNGIPPYWAPYFEVADADQSAERAQRLKAQVHVPPTDIPNVGRFAVLQDPTGASFSIIRMNPRK